MRQRITQIRRPLDKDGPSITGGFETLLFAPTRRTLKTLSRCAFSNSIERCPKTEHLPHYRARTEPDHRIGDKTPASTKQNASTVPCEADT